MKNRRLYPFERNRYFYGKLLTVRDFDTEQKYFNNKRRLLNKLINGGGVVCGLQVVAIDDKTISIEPGIAIDYSGREIVVSSPITKKLSMVEGFSNNEYAKDIYLCINYDEKGKEPVHSMSNLSESSDEVSEYNRIQESYRIFVKEEAPNNNSNLIDLVKDIKTIYDDGKVRISQSIPRFINSEEVFEMTVKVEKILQISNLEFEYTLELENIFADTEERKLKISFDESEYTPASEYEIKYFLKSRGASNIDGRILVKESNIKLKVDDRQFNATTTYSTKVKIIDGSIEQKVLKNYFNRSLDECVESNSEQSICLAKISLLQVGPTFMIENVKTLPFEEYIYNLPLIEKISSLTKNNSNTRFLAKASSTILEGDEAKVIVNFDNENNEFDFKFGVPRAKVLFGDVNTGVIELDCEENIKARKSYYSEEIDHGLGLGDVLVTVGIEEKDSEVFREITGNDEQVFYGDSEIFRDSPYEPILPTAKTAVIVYPKKGTFRVGVRFNNSSLDFSKVKIRWWAYRRLVNNIQGKDEFYIDPHHVKIKSNEKYKFEIISNGVSANDIRWIVDDINGGTIDKNGLYTAPDVNGVFRIKAVSKRDPLKNSSAFVVVDKEF